MMSCRPPGTRAPRAPRLTNAQLGEMLIDASDSLDLNLTWTREQVYAVIDELYELRQFRDSVRAALGDPNDPASERTRDKIAARFGPWLEEDT